MGPGDRLTGLWPWLNLGLGQAGGNCSSGVRGAGDCNAAAASTWNGRTRYETGGMRRTHLRGHANILNLVHVGGIIKFGIGPSSEWVRRR